MRSFSVGYAFALCLFVAGAVSCFPLFGFASSVSELPVLTHVARSVAARAPGSYRRWADEGAECDYLDEEAAPQACEECEGTEPERSRGLKNKV
jgi:hypothetical protein